MKSINGLVSLSIKIFALTVIAVHFILNWLFPQTILIWGIDFLAYLPAPFQICWYLIGIIAILLIPEKLTIGISPIIQRISSTYETLTRKHRSFPLLISFIIFLTGITLMIFFRQRYHLLGDQIFNTGLPSHISLKRLSDLIRDLSGFFAVNFHIIPDNINPREFIYYFSALHGGIFILLSLLFAQRFGKTSLEKVIIFLFLVTGQYMFIFFGTGDNYYTSLVMFLWYFYELFLFLEGKGCFWRLIVSCLLSIYAHPEGLALAPSCFFALYFTEPKNYKRIISIVGLVSLVILIYFFWKKVGGETTAVFNVPWFVEKNNRYPIFSFYKLSYFLNIYLSNALTGFALCIIGIFIFLRKALTTSVTKEPLISRATWIILSPIPFIFFCDIFTEHALGVSDQDMATLSALMITMIGIWLILTYGKKYLSFSVIILNLWLLVPMVFVFHTYANVNRMITLYPKDKAQVMNEFSPYVWLGMRFRYEPDLQQETLAQFKLGFTQENNPEFKLFSMLHYSYWAYRFGQDKEGFASMKTLLETTPDKTGRYLQQIHRLPEQMKTDVLEISRKLFVQTENPIYQQIITAVNEIK